MRDTVLEEHFGRAGGEFPLSHTRPRSLEHSAPGSVEDLPAGAHQDAFLGRLDGLKFIDLGCQVDQRFLREGGLEGLIIPDGEVFSAYDRDLTIEALLPQLVND